MKLDALRKKAQSNLLEVEDLLEAAAERLPGLSEELLRLSSDLAWSRSGVLADGTNVVPLAKRAQIAAAYASGGFDALLAFVARRQDAPLVLALLEQIKSSEAILFLLRAYTEVLHDPVRAPDLAFKIASTINLVLSFKPSVVLTEHQAKEIREFLGKAFPVMTTDAQRAAVMLAFRGVGDAETIQFLASLEELQQPWEGTKQASIQAIRRRLRANAL